MSANQFRQYLCRLSAALVLCVFAISPLSCGGKGTQHIPLKGSVTYRGIPVLDGIISFFPAADPSKVISTEIRQGRYACGVEDGITVGDYRVEIEGFRKTGRRIPDLVTPREPGQPPATIDEKVSYIPTKYNSASRTNVMVTLDTTELNFQLTP